MTTLTADWVTRVDDMACEHCVGIENVFALKLACDVPTYLCVDCLCVAAGRATGMASWPSEDKR